MNEEEKIKEILASLDPQLKVDAIKIVEQSNTDDKERKIKFMQRLFVKKQKDNYPKNEKKLQEDKGKYTESFRKAVEEEKIKKQEEKIRREEEILRKKAEKEKIRKIIYAYERTSIKEEDMNRLYEIYETKILNQENKSEVEKKRTFFMIIKDFLTRKEKHEQEQKLKQKQAQEKEKQKEIKTNTREQFVQGLKVKTIVNSNVQPSKVTQEKGKELEK